MRCLYPGTGFGRGWSSGEISSSSTSAGCRFVYALECEWMNGGSRDALYTPVLMSRYMVAFRRFRWQVLQVRASWRVLLWFR